VPDFAEFYERDRGHHNNACRQVNREPDGRALPKLHDMQQLDQFSATVPPLGGRSFMIENRSTA
jgi:hypothetical protein